MAALPKFSFSGWTSQSLAPKVNPATTPSQIATEAAGGIEGIQLKGLVDAGLGESIMAKALRAKLNPPVTTGALVGTTNAANTNLPQWLQSEVDRLNAQEALRNAALGGTGGGGATAPPAFDPNIGVAAVTNARANYNQQVFGMNERARLANLVQSRRNLQVGGSPGLYDLSGATGLDREIRNFQNLNIPTSSGWVGGGGGRRGSVWANGMLNGTGYA